MFANSLVKWTGSGSDVSQATGGAGDEIYVVADEAFVSFSRRACCPGALSEVGLAWSHSVQNS